MVVRVWDMLCTVESMKHLSGSVWVHHICDAKCLLRAPIYLGEQALEQQLLHLPCTIQASLRGNRLRSWWCSATQAFSWAAESFSHIPISPHVEWRIHLRCGSGWLLGPTLPSQTSLCQLNCGADLNHLEIAQKFNASKLCNPKFWSFNCSSKSNEQKGCCFELKKKIIMWTIQLTRTNTTV